MNVQFMSGPMGKLTGAASASAAATTDAATSSAAEIRKVEELIPLLCINAVAGVSHVRRPIFPGARLVGETMRLHIVVVVVLRNARGTSAAVKAHDIFERRPSSTA